MRIRSVQITGDGEDATVIVGVETETAGQQTVYRYTGAVQVQTTTHSSGYLHLSISVTPGLARKRENSEKNVPPHRFGE